MEFHLLPKYSATTVIEALKIREVRHLIKAGAKVTRIVPEDERYPMFDILNDDRSIGRRQEFYPGDYWVRFQDGSTMNMLASTVEESYRPATPLTPEMLGRLRAVVAKDLISDEEINTLNQMVLNELHQENQGVIGGPDVIHMQHPARLAEAVTEMVLAKLSAIPA